MYLAPPPDLLADADRGAVVHGASFPQPSSTGNKVLRTVPQANPFKPRRSASYLTGPTLCDSSFDTLNDAFGEAFLAKKKRIQSSSPMAQALVAQHQAETGSKQPNPTEALAQWDLVSVIFKGGDDLQRGQPVDVESVL